jgi:hypothetical protein
LEVLSSVSDSILSGLPSVLAAATVLGAIFWIAVRRPGLGLIFFLFFFAFAWRTSSALVIDLFGPLFSDQLDRHIGPGMSAVPLAIAQGFVIVAVLFSFRRQRLQRRFVQGDLGLGNRLSGGNFNLSDLCFLAVTLFVFALWAELLVKGRIPLFEGMERFDYSQKYGGPLHHALLRWGPMLAFQLGIFFVAPVLRGRPFDLRFSALFAVLILYLFLVGHRFSSFYAYTSFFFMPVGAAMLLGRQFTVGLRREIIPRKFLRYFWLGGAALVVLIMTSLIYSYTVVRGFEGQQLVAKLSQRILVQQGEMWWMTYDRVFLHNDWNGGEAAFQLFADPFDPTRDSTMQFLMQKALPLDRAHFILSQGSAYTGGWPEVFFELGGPLGGFIFVALAAIIFSEFMYFLIRCFVEERFATCFFLTPILFALSINLLSGMVNSFIQITFLIKLVVFGMVYVIEQRWRSGLFSSGQTGDAVPPTVRPEGTFHERR